MTASARRMQTLIQAEWEAHRGGREGRWCGRCCCCSPDRPSEAQERWGAARRGSLPREAWHWCRLGVLGEVRSLGTERFGIGRVELEAVRADLAWVLVVQPPARP